MPRLHYAAFVLGVVATLAFLGGRDAWACSIPVFRYALERWPAEPYQAVVFHRGPLTPDEEKAVEALRKAAAAEAAPANLDVQDVDLAGKLDKEAEALWKREGAAETPWVVILYPYGLRIEEKAWSGRLAAEPTMALLDSPARRDLAKRLIAGDCAAWLLVESGDKAKDDAAAKLIGEELRKLEKTLELPSPDFGGGGFDDPAFTEEARRNLRVAFSLVRVSRADKAESAFLDLLLSVDAELKKEKEAMAFAVFGQGRALPPLVGAGINADNVADVCSFLVGPCSCQVKAMNPGWDLLMAADWLAALEGREAGEPDPLTLTGSVRTPLPKEGVTSAVVPAPATLLPPPPPPTRAERSLLRAIVLAVVVGVILLGVVSAVLLRRRDA